MAGSDTPSGATLYQRAEGALTVNQLRRYLDEQAAHGRGDYRVLVAQTGSRNSLIPRVVAGAPDSTGDVVVVFATKAGH